MPSIKIRDLRQLVAGSAFLLLFPGFFIYHTLVGAGTVPPFLGGMFSPIALILLPPLLILYFGDWSRGRLLRTSADRSFWVFIALFGIVILANASQNANRYVIATHLTAILHFVVCFLVFRLLDFGGAKIYKANFVAALAMAAVIAYLSADGAFYLRELEDEAEGSVAGYQGYARSYLLLMLVILPFINYRVLRVVFYAVGTAALFLIGARSEFVALIMVVAILEINTSKRRFLYAGVIIALGIGALLFLDNLAANLPDNRILQLLNIDRADSWQARNELTQNAWDTIQRSPIFGEYGRYAGLQDARNFAHNILSAWVDLGFFGFLYILGMLGVPLALVLRRLAATGVRNQIPEFTIAFSTLLVTVFLLFTAKNFLYMLIGVSMGAYARYVAVGKSQEGLNISTEAR